MYENLISKYYNDIFKWSLSKARNMHDAEDLTQEIIYQILKTFSKDLAIIDKEKYIWKIAYYTWCNRALQYKEQKNIALIDKDVLDNVKDNKINIEQSIELEETINILKNIMSKFSNRMQKCLKIYYFEHFTIKEIGLQLNIKESLVKYYLYAARKKIRSELNGKY